MHESIYMIRGGSFGTNFEIKLALGVIALAACLYDWRTRGRRDYLWIFLTGFIVWTGIELFIQARGVRAIVESRLFGMPLPMPCSAALRGISEGAAVAIIGIFFGDRIMGGGRRRAWSAAFIVILCVITLLVLAQGSAGANVGGEVPSRRNMFTSLSIVYMALMVAVDAAWLAGTDHRSRKRGVAMLLVMICFASAWTVAEYAANTRWIEIGGPSFTRASPMVEFPALGYDVVVEIAVAYLPFFIIPSVLGLISGEEVAA
ncbi:MAG: hypothetical protein JW838_14495 [Spirochaetes bacterium]|nr:hypothetical protein [Spirochaetota bacterium]